MNPLAREWLYNAEGDCGTAGREMRARKTPNFNAACFHAQQCAEKYLKAFLQEQGIPFGKTHNLVALLDQALAAVPSLELLRPDLQRLNLYAVQFRYPGECADKPAAREAVSICSRVREALRTTLRLRPPRG